jgi:putative colanic acid biosynthesis UDP-glucose lipid carrier transferase
MNIHQGRANRNNLLNDDISLNYGDGVCLFPDPQFQPTDDFVGRALKRAFDIIFSLLVIVLVMSWLYPVIAFLIKATSPGRACFTQKRSGLERENFTIFKFRSMTEGNNDIGKDGKYAQATKNDARVTPIGKIIRKTSLDEFPQFFNVLLGDMSVVGPRPHPIKLDEESIPKIRNYVRRFEVKPGITGWAQVSGYRGEADTRDIMQGRINHDIWYIENWSLLLDLKIIFLTVYNVIKGDQQAY